MENGVAKRSAPQFVEAVPIMLDRERHIRFGMQDCMDAEELYSRRKNNGKEYAFGDMVNDGTMHAVCVLLWAGLRHEDPSLTLQDVMGMIRPSDMNRVHKAIIAAAMDQTVVPENEREPSDQKKTPSESQESNAGAPSGASPE